MYRQPVTTCAYLAPQSWLRGHTSLEQDCSASRTLGSPLNSICSSSSNKPNSHSIQSNSFIPLAHRCLSHTLELILVVSRWRLTVFCCPIYIITWSWYIDNWLLNWTWNKTELFFRFYFLFYLFLTVRSNTNGHNLKFVKQFIYIYNHLHTFLTPIYILLCLFFILYLSF